MKVRDVIRRLERDGWVHVRTTGSHRHFKHGTRPGVVTVPGHMADDLAQGALKSIWRQAGIEDKK